MCAKMELPVEGELAMRMMRLTRKRIQLNDMRLEKFGIGAGQVPILLDVERLGRCRQHMLAERMFLTPATVSAALKRLEKNGLIERNEDETDARATVVTLTEDGKKACRTVRKILDDANRDICADISGDECREMIALFDIMLKNAENAIGEVKK